MTKHPTDLFALMLGLAFTIAGALVIVTQATSVDVSPQWGAAVGLIVLGAVALVATVVRAGTGSLAPAPSVVDDDVAAEAVSSEEPAD